jgi:diguanylate cyclase (GGDEF)-like protein
MSGTSNEEFVASYNKIFGGKYLLFTESERQGLLSELKGLVRNLFLFAILLGAISVIVAVRFSKKLIEPIQELMGFVDHLAVGRFDSFKTINSQDEIQDLSEHFSRLGQKLFDREKELADATELANRDSMTGLYNYRFFAAQLARSFEEVKRYKRPLSVLLIDVDYFKKVNDTYGHPQGDLVLKELAQMLKSICRTTDFPCRYGGEEFAILTHETGLDGAKIFAERIRKRFEEMDLPIIGTNEILKKTLSIGVSCAQADDCLTTQRLVEVADEKLYKAKNGGRNKVVA